MRGHEQACGFFSASMTKYISETDLHEADSKVRRIAGDEEGELTPDIRTRGQQFEGAYPSPW